MPEGEDVEESDMVGSPVRTMRKRLVARQRG
jgi:hypothetical protein